MKKHCGSSHEGKVVTDGYRDYRIVDGQRIWLDEPPPEYRLEMQIENRRLEESRAIARQQKATLRKLRNLKK